MSIRRMATGIAIAGSVLALSAGPAAAGHCADNGGPGNSDFADHVQADKGQDGHNEGGHSGWASCEGTAQEENSSGRATPQD